MTFRQSFGFSLLLVLMSCGPTLEDKTESLVVGKDKWIESVGDKNYSFDLRRECFCSFSGDTFRVSVRDGLSRISSPYTDFQLEKDEFEPQLLSIKELFELVLELIKREFGSEGELDVEYDEALGYPSVIEWTNNQVMDGSFSIYVGNIELE